MSLECERYSFCVGPSEKKYDDVVYWKFYLVETPIDYAIARTGLVRMKSNHIPEKPKGWVRLSDSVTTVVTTYLNHVCSTDPLSRAEKIADVGPMGLRHRNQCTFCPAGAEFTRAFFVKKRS